MGGRGGGHIGRDEKKKIKTVHPYHHQANLKVLYMIRSFDRGLVVEYNAPDTNTHGHEVFNFNDQRALDAKCTDLSKTNARGV